MFHIYDFIREMTGGIILVRVSESVFFGMMN